ncbi:hypothetical protein [uncultured Bacteroides sp.]|uniref:hypothetical protein n=1 Tax=uncultured Bacteroides sp. TaxID=162156 RepID=UPI002AA8E759|nr:hypothetical protein [uncultured Bacteroides sp.]
MATELIKVEAFTSIMQTAPDSLNRNQASVENSNNAGQTLIDTIESCGGMTDELDVKVSEYLGKIRITKTKMEERRKPITQIFDQVRNVFTTLEKNIDIKDKTTVPGKLSFMRDQYATKKLEEEKKRKAETLRRQNIENEKVTYKASLEMAISRHFNDYFNSNSALLSQIWKSLNYSNFAEKENIIREWSLMYPSEHYKMFRDTVSTYYLDPITKTNIQTEVATGKYEALVQQYKFDMEDLRQSFIDRLPSRQKEIMEIEALRKVNEQEAEKKEHERREREDMERKQRELEAAQAQAKQEAVSAAAAQVSQMNNLFDASAATVTSTPVKAKVTEKIQILHPAGILEIYQMWWADEGQSLPIDELEKIHKKMITFCEKKANKDDEHIKSNYIKYVDDVKAK